MPFKDVPNISSKPHPGHPGNLDETQDQALRNFWSEWLRWLRDASGPDTPGKPAESQGDKPSKRKDGDEEDGQAVQALINAYSGPALEQGLWDMAKFETADSVFCRFLRARKWNLKRSTAMFAAALKWRMDSAIEELVRGGDEGNAHLPHFIDQQTSGKVLAYGATQKEQLMIYITVRKHLTNGQPDDSMEKFVLYAMETYRYLMQPPAGTVSLVFDLEGFGLKNMDWHVLMYVVECLEKYYPECLGTLYVLHAPWIFNGIWKTLGPMLDPVVRAKVQFIKRMPDAAPNLPQDRVPKHLGGEADFEYHYPESKPGDNKLLQDTDELNKRLEIRDDLWRELAKISEQWAPSGDKKLGDQRRLLAKKIRAAHFDVEPYYRGSTLFDRGNILSRDGRVTWFYVPVNGGQTWRHVIGRAHCTPTLHREIRDVEENNLSVSEAENRTHEAIHKQDWITLYGSEEVAVKVEGSEAVGVEPKQTASASQNGLAESQKDGSGSKNGTDVGSKDSSSKSAAGAAAGAGAGAGAGAAAAAGGAAHANSKNGTLNGTRLEFQGLRRINSGSSQQSYETFLSAATEIEALPNPGEEGTTTYIVPGSSQQGEKDASKQEATEGEGQANEKQSPASSPAQSDEPTNARSSTVRSSREKSGPASTESSFAAGDDGSDSRSTRRHSRLFGHNGDSDSKSSLHPFRRKHPHLRKLTDKVVSKLKIDSN